MSTPQTLSHTVTIPPHQHMRYLPSPQDRYLPPPRPSSSVQAGYPQHVPTRPSSNLSARQLPPPSRPESVMSSGAYPHSYSQSRGGAEYTYTNATSHHTNHDELRRTENGSAYQHNRTLPPPPPQHTAPTSRALAASGADMPSTRAPHYSRSGSTENPSRKRRQKDQVDWVQYFGGRLHNAHPQARPRGAT